MARSTKKAPEEHPFYHIKAGNQSSGCKMSTCKGTRFHTGLQAKEQA
mgnify:CR=1 FL=1